MNCFYYVLVIEFVDMYIYMYIHVCFKEFW